MAKISAEYDTNTKQLSVSKDGQAMSNVMRVEFGRTYESEDKSDADAEHGCHIHMLDKGDDGYHTHTHMTANEQGDLVSEKKVSNKLSKYIGDYLKARR